MYLLQVGLGKNVFVGVNRVRLLFLLLLFSGINASSSLAQDDGTFVEVKREESVPFLHRYHPLSIHTNLLSWFFLIPSAGFEYAFANQWSVSGTYYHTWLSCRRHHKYWRYYGGDIELRYWITRQQLQQPLAGHHVGLDARIYTYDFKLDNVGLLAKSPQVGVGLTYGYTVRVKERISIDCTLGLGVIHGKHDRYTYNPSGDCYVWNSTHEKTRFSPTKIAVTVSYLLR